MAFNKILGITFPAQQVFSRDGYFGQHGAAGWRPEHLFETRRFLGVVSPSTNQKCRTMLQERGIDPDGLLIVGRIWKPPVMANPPSTNFSFFWDAIVMEAQEFFKLWDDSLSISGFPSGPETLLADAKRRGAAYLTVEEYAMLAQETWRVKNF